MLTVSPDCVIVKMQVDSYMPVLWIEFVNSHWHDHLGRVPPEDRLDRGGWLVDLAGRHDLTLPDPLGRRDLESLRSLRDALGRLARAVARGEEPAADDLAVVDTALGGVGVRCRLASLGDAFRLALDPTDGGVRALAFRIAASFGEFLADADRTRLKVCENPDCLWVFYDETRSRTRRWCADSCGNLMKVRRFRARRREHE